MRPSIQGKNNPNYKDGRFNGKRFTLRLPDELHSKIVQAAKEREVSMNDLIIMWLETAAKGESNE